MSVARSPLHARLASATVAVMTAEALALDTWPVVGVAAALALLDGLPGASPFRVLARLAVSGPYPLRPDAPARRGALLRAAALGAATVLLALGLDVAGVVVAAAVALDAAADAVLGRCVTSSVRFGARPDPVDALALEGPGPWVVGVGVGGDPLCERVVETAVERTDGVLERRDLDEFPRVAALVRLVPAILVVDTSGGVAGRLEGPRDPEQIERFLAARSPAGAGADS